jgi:hypothetical protein
LINDVPDRPGDRCANRHRAAATLAAGVAAAAILAAGAVAGCGGGDDTTTTGPATGAEGATTTGTSPETTTGGGTTTTGDGGTAEGDAEQGRTIRDVVIAVLATGDSKRACSSDYVTDSYISAAYGDQKGCEQAQTKASAAESLPIQAIELGKLKPPTAVAKVAPRGGQYDGDRLAITLIKEDGVWKIDSLKSNAPVGP